MKLYDLYKKLRSNIGPVNWWPAETPFEVVVGAILTQQTKWSNVEKAINNLKAESLLGPGELAGADISHIESLIRCTGFYRQKATRLKEIAGFFTDDEVFDRPADRLRKELLDLNGVGNETADSILLYAANKPRFVIDAYTRKICKCIGISGNYQFLQKKFEGEIPIDSDLYKEFHGLIVEYGKRYCGKKKCEECILKYRKA